MKRKLRKSIDHTLQVLLFIQVAALASLNYFELNIMSLSIIFLWIAGMIANYSVLKKYGSLFEKNK